MSNNHKHDRKDTAANKKELRGAKGLPHAEEKDTKPNALWLYHFIDRFFGGTK